MLNAVRPQFRETATAAGELAMSNIVSYANAAHGGNPRSGQRSTPIADPGNYRYGVDTIPRGVRLEILVTNSDPNFMIKFHALNTGRRGRRPQRAVKPSVIAFPGSGYRISKQGNIVTQRIAGDSGGEVSGFYKNAVQDALAAYNLT
jgi:hypothetical protein